MVITWAEVMLMAISEIITFLEIPTSTPISEIQMASKTPTVTQILETSIDSSAVTAIQIMDLPIVLSEPMETESMEDSTLWEMLMPI